MADPQEAGKIVAAVSRELTDGQSEEPQKRNYSEANAKRAERQILRWGRGKVRDYGNNADYLTARIARDRPDILERMKADEYPSVRQAAIEAGIIKSIPPEDAGIERLFTAWARATLQERQIFLWALEEEFEATWAGEYREPPIGPPRKGPRPYRMHDGEMGMPEVEALIDRGWSVSGLAREIGVTYRTLSRWRGGETKPNQAQRERLSQLTMLAVTGEAAAAPATGPAEGEAEGQA